MSIKESVHSKVVLQESKSDMVQAKWNVIKRGEGQTLKQTPGTNCWNV